MTFELMIVRDLSAPHGTHGKLTSSVGFHCDTLELPWADNKKGVSCILPKTRSAWLWFSPTLKRMVIRLEDTDGRNDCLLHNGTFAGTAEGDITQVHGCTEVGQGVGQVGRPDGKTQFGIMHSVNTLAMLVDHVIANVGEHGKFLVTHSWGIGCEPAIEES